MSRLSIEITESQHQRIKALAALRGVSLKDFILERTLTNEDNVSDAEEKKALDELRRFLEPRIEEARRGEYAEFTVEQIFERAIARRRKRTA